jgi:hypothetical protein
MTGRRVEGSTAIRKEVKRMKTTFSLDPKVVDKLREVAFFAREPMSEIVERLITEYVGSSKFKNVPQRPAKKS